jgi:cell division topological specificity factor
MFENVIKFFKGLGKNEKEVKSKDAAKERLHLVLMQDRANISADFLALMKQEIIEVIKKYIDVDENAIDVRLTNKSNDDGTTGAPVLYANIPIVSVKEEAKEEVRKEKKQEEKSEENKKEIKEEKKNNKETVKKSEVLSDNKKTEEIIEKAEEIVEEIKEESIEE